MFLSTWLFLPRCCATPEHRQTWQLTPIVLRIERNQWDHRSRGDRLDLIDCSATVGDQRMDRIYSDQRRRAVFFLRRMDWIQKSPKAGPSHGWSAFICGSVPRRHVDPGLPYPI